MKARINNKSYIHFESFQIDSSLDAVASTFSLTALWEIDNLEHRNLFRPLSYNKIEIFDDDDKLQLTGTILNHDFYAHATTDLIELSGYSLPGVIEDCNIPYSMYPLESLKMNLREIAEKLIKPFGLNLIVDQSASREVNLVYAKTSLEPQDSIKDYLSKLASQRNIIISHDENGHLRMFKPNINGDIKMIFNDQNSINLGLTVNGQGMHNVMTILRQPKAKKKKTEKRKPKQVIDYFDDDGNQIAPIKKTKMVKRKPKPLFFDTLNNEMVKSFRPSVRKMTEGEDVSTEAAVRNYMADEMKNITFVIDLNRWENLKFGDMIELESKRLFLNKKIRLMISSISKGQSASEKTMSILAVLPESYTGDEPKNIFL